MSRSRLEACTLTGTFSHLSKLRILRPRNLKIGMTRNIFLIPRIRNQRVMMTFLRRFQILMPRNLRTGMMKKMVSGLLQPFPIQNTRVHGRPRKSRILTTRENGRHL